MNFEQARSNMVEQQVRTWEVLDPAVLDVLGSLHREDFVPVAQRRLAYADLSLPIGEGQHMMKPVVEGRLLQALEIKPGDEVLEIGTGSGYLTACLARLGGKVTSVEYHESLSRQAAARLRDAEGEIQLEVGDALVDFQPQGRFDAIAVTGSVAELPERFVSWLRPGGRIFFVRGDSPVMEAVVAEKSEQGLIETSLFETDLDRLIGAEPPPKFTL